MCLVKQTSMITITNKHIGIGIIFLILSTPWICYLQGIPLVTGDSLTALGGIILAEMIIVTVIGVGLLVHTLLRLLDPNHEDSIEFSWKIKLPRIGRDRSLSIDSDTRKLLQELAHVDKNSDRYETIWQELNKRKVFG